MPDISDFAKGFSETSARNDLSVTVNVIISGLSCFCIIEPCFRCPLDYKIYSLIKRLVESLISTFSTYVVVGGVISSF